jgi:hypothetical protein
MQYLLTEEEYEELKANQINAEYVKKLEDEAKEFVKQKGCNTKKGFGYCGDCPLVGMSHNKLGFPYCIAGEYREFPK